ncbi:MAG TPA: MerR family transcriptional regulator [Candidatus Acidoferrales bacterium]|nr:MerR family transcriptional regulator [Candidatus Acidoferrales bacterium]
MGPRLPDKLYFKIGEVSRILQVKPYVLRYWETEFDVLKPGKAPSRHRLYRRKDVELLLEIKRLLYSEGYTIEGARKKLRQNRREERQQLRLPLPDSKYRTALIKIKKDLESLHKALSQ